MQSFSFLGANGINNRGNTGKCKLKSSDKCNCNLSIHVKLQAYRKMVKKYCKFT